MKAFFSTVLIGSLIWLMSKILNKSMRNAEEISKKREEELREQQATTINTTELRKNPDTGVYEPFDE